MKMKQIILQR